MKPAFFAIVGAQFFSSLADSALFILCVSLITTLAFPAWMTPLLKMGFVLSYILLAPFAGAFADRFPKGRVMLVTNTVKMLGCSLILAKANPLLAYGIVGFGASAYSPAKYGILAEVLPARRLVAANGWIEGSTVISVILGTVLGGLISANPHAIAWLLHASLPFRGDVIHTPLGVAVAVIVLTYLLATLFNLVVVDAGARYARPARPARTLFADFFRCNARLWRDREGRVSLGVTSLFWGAGMVLQVLLLAWAQSALGLGLDRAAALQGVFALGVALGAALAGKAVPLVRSLAVMPLGIVMGLALCGMVFVHTVWLALPLLLAIGVLAGVFVVPMNAILQHRGHRLMSAGQSIAVQNFNENLAILAMSASYALALQAQLGLDTVLVTLGLLVALVTLGLRSLSAAPHESRPRARAPAAAYRTPAGTTVRKKCYANAMTTPQPPYTDPAHVVDALRGEGYVLLRPADVAALAGCALAELRALAPSWDRLEPDNYLKDGGRYRRRRHSCFVDDGAGLAQSPHRAHWQPVEYNALHGGMHRLFVPIEPATVAQPAWHKLLRALGGICSQVKGERTWYVEAHQFRIDTADGIGRPTPEGAHRDGVDLVAVILIDRHAIKGGETRVFEADGPRGQRFTMTEPWTMLLLDDAAVIHESTPIQPLGAHGHRDTLVLTWRAGAFQGDDAPTSGA